MTPPPATARSRPRVLCVEAFEPIRTIRKLVLERHGYSVTIAATADDAQDRIRQLEFDVMLIDDALSDGNGSSIVQKLHQSQPQARVIVLSSLWLAAEQHRFGKCDACFEKGMAPQELFRLIERMRD